MIESYFIKNSFRNILKENNFFYKILQVLKRVVSVQVLSFFRLHELTL